MRVFYFSTLALFCIVLTHCRGKHEAGSSDITQAYVLEALDIIKHHSIKRDSLDWNSLEHAALNRIDEIKAQSTEDCYRVIKYILWSLGDRHSHFKEPSQAKAWAEKAFGTHFGIQATLLDDHIASVCRVSAVVINLLWWLMPILCNKKSLLLTTCISKAGFLISGTILAETAGR